MMSLIENFFFEQYLTSLPKVKYYGKHHTCCLDYTDSFRLMATSLQILSMFRTYLGSQQAGCCAVTCDLQGANQEQVFAESDEERASNSQCLASD